jgi:hypothetical protein
MTLLASWPTLVDDSGDGTSGTVLDKAVFDAVKASVEDQVHSTNNSTVKPKAITDEVVTARGNMTDLEDRLDGVIDPDGNLITPASVVSAAQLQSQSAASQNCLMNSTFFLWSGGLAVAPDYYTLANGTVSIAGTSETDTERYIGAKCAKLTWSSGTASLKQTILNATDFANLDHLKVQTKKIGFGCWVKSSIASHARLQIDDGTLTTETDYHTGGGGWEWLSAVHTMSAAATKIVFGLLNEQSGACYFSGGVVNFADFAPPLWYSEPKIRGSYAFKIPGTLTVADAQHYVTFSRPTYVQNVQAICITPPVGADLNTELQKFETGAAYVDMHTAGALIDDGDSLGNIQTGGDYDHRCLAGNNIASGATTALLNMLVQFNITQVGSGTAGSDLIIRLDAVQCRSPFEEHLSYNFVGG